MWSHHPNLFASLKGVGGELKSRQTWGKDLADHHQSLLYALFCFAVYKYFTVMLPLPFLQSFGWTEV